MTGLGVASVVGLAVVGLAGGSGPSSTHLEQSSRVVLVSVPGLRWQDLDAVPAPNLFSLLRATALLSIRSIGPDTSLAEGYLALGAGNRLETPSPPPDELGQTDELCAPDLVEQARELADDELNGAEPGRWERHCTRPGVRRRCSGRRRRWRD